MTFESGKKQVFLSFIAGITALLLASAAFACGTWRGKFTVTAGGGSTTGIGINGSGMQYCGGGQSNYTETGGGAQLDSLNDVASIEVKVEPASTCLDSNNVNQLPSGKYTINFANGRWTGDTFGLVPTQDCMNLLIVGGGAPTDGMGVPIGTIDINSSGYSLDSSGAQGSRTYSLAGLVDGANDDSKVCISSSTGGNNNQVPVTFI